MGQSHRFSRQVIERLRVDFQKAVRVSGTNIEYKLLKTIVEFGSSSYALDDAIEQDPLYPQPAFVGSISDDKLYTAITVMAIVNHNPKPSELRDLGLNKKTEITVTIAALTLEQAGIVPDDQSDRFEVNGIEYDIVDINTDWLVEGNTGTVKSLCSVFGAIKRSGRI